MGKNRIKSLITSDMKANNHNIGFQCDSKFLSLLILLHNNRYFRSLFYFRIGPILTLFISWIRPGDRYLIFSNTTKIGKGVKLFHPYSSVINAYSIGNNFSFGHLTTIGLTGKGRPTIGDNVSLGANAIIIGNVKIGNNVIIGAGSVVVKDIEDNVVVAGNPAKVIKRISVD